MNFDHPEHAVAVGALHLRLSLEKSNFSPYFSPDRLRVRGARGPRAGGHRDGEAGRVSHLRGLLGAGARQRLQRACAHETVAEAQQEHLKIYIIYWLPATKSIFFMFFNSLHIINRKCKLFN